jgi:hypothetical protein
MNLRYTLSAFSLALGVIALAPAPSAFATVIKFKCGGSGGGEFHDNSTGKDISCPTSPYQIPAGVIFTQDGFHVGNYPATYTNSSWSWITNAGGTAAGGTAAALEGGDSKTTTPTSNTFTNVLYVDDPGAVTGTWNSFYFDSVDLKGDFVSYTINGYGGTPGAGTAVPEYTITCTSASDGCTPDLTSWTTISSSTTGITVTDDTGYTTSSPITSLTIKLVNPAADDPPVFLDDIDVTATPEPGTLFLLGSGLSALAFAVRRRLGA